MNTDFPAMVDGKTRRPDSYTRADYVPYDPRNDPHPDGRGTMGRVACFEYREDAVAAGQEWCAGWDVRPQYMGRYDLWMLEARRKSWSSGRYVLVEACRDPEATVTGHAHVPMTFSYDRLAAARDA